MTFVVFEKGVKKTEEAVLMKPSVRVRQGEVLWVMLAMTAVP